MAEAIVSAVIDQLASVIGKELEQEVRLVVGVRKEVKKLEPKLTLIKAVLEDAEKKEIHENAVKIWLEDLKDVMYDADDVLDEWNTRILISRIEGFIADGSHVANKMCSYLLSPCACLKHGGARYDIAHRIKDIRERLAEVALTNKDQLHLLPIGDVENPSIYEAKKLRTLLVGIPPRSVPSALHQLTCLRTLDLSARTSVLEVLPSEVSRLLHLRYLDLSNTRLKELPETLRSLVNLQTLKLNRCLNLCKLPEGFVELSNLRHLEVELTSSLKYYPRGGIERLRQLRTLSKFVVSDGSSKGSVIGELGNLNFLKGSLSITGLRHVKSVNEAKQAELQKKKNISALLLNFGDEVYPRDIRHVSSEEYIRRMEGVLENLEPDKETLERLEIEHYVGSTLPSTWMMSNITYLRLYYCPNLKVEPHYLFPPRLESLVLLYDVGVLSKSLMSLTHNNNLKSLFIYSLPHFSLPQGLNQLTSLQQLSFYSCKYLDFKPEELKPLTMLRELQIYNCPRELQIYNWRQLPYYYREEDWSILTHIPNILIDGEDIKSRN
ncbi:hypothetical protein IFM89_024623 [Coptis chinensis]|uniref:Rx N-terminal domain-containing protein n=1 Tax=Coptis chinensis TaxID=261450 RepID=A0A835I6W6_9MAGN|nr:hypothetical protein IFM89_024623 [Coptis chinensis]